LLQISLNNYYFSFYGIGDAIKAWKGCGIAQRRLCRSNKDDRDGDFGLPPACRGRPGFLTMTQSIAAPLALAALASENKGNEKHRSEQ